MWTSNNRYSPYPKIFGGVSSFSVIIFFIVIILIGGTSACMLAVAVQPEQKSDNLIISFVWPGTPAESVEQQVTSKLEGLLSIVRGVGNISSQSSNGRGMVSAEIDKNTKKSQIRYEVASLVAQFYKTLPSGVSYPQVETYENYAQNAQILEFAIMDKRNDGSALFYAENTIKPQLQGLEGVLDVSITGGADTCIEVRFDQAKMQKYGVTRWNTSEAITNFFTQRELGSVLISKANFLGMVENYVYLKVAAQVYNDDQIWRKIEVKRIGERVLYLTDIAAVSLQKEANDGFKRINGHPAIVLHVSAKRNSDNIAVSSAVKKMISNIYRKDGNRYDILTLRDETAPLSAELSRTLKLILATLSIVLVLFYAVSLHLSQLFLIIVSLIGTMAISCVAFFIAKLNVHVYSLTAIAISSGLIVDNSIVVIDHLRYKKDLRVVLAVVGATLAILASVSIVFFLGSETKKHLRDFAWVLIISLASSVLVAMFLIPAMIDQYSLYRFLPAKKFNAKRKIVRANQYYLIFIRFLSRKRYRLAAIVLIVLSFGIPVFKMPENIKGTTMLSRFYNHLFDNDLFQNDIRPKLDILIGGSLRLFFNNVEHSVGNVSSIPKNKIIVSINMPDGIDIGLMDKIVVNLENYLQGFKEIQGYETDVLSGQHASITITFKEGSRDGAFPYFLKNELENLALYTGLAEFDIQGVGKGFNNSQKRETANYGITLCGYNYDKLTKIANDLRLSLKKNPRIEKISIGEGDIQRVVDENVIYQFKMTSPETLLLRQMNVDKINRALDKLISGKQLITNVFFANHRSYPISVSEGDIPRFFDFSNDPMQLDSGVFLRLNKIAALGKTREPSTIYRNNQQYELNLVYHFVGDEELGKLTRDNIYRDLKPKLPLGYTIKDADTDYWYDRPETLSWALVLSIALVLIICTALLNDLRQAIAVIAMIPCSFIGVFFTVAASPYDFGEGGYTGLIILSGTVVSAALYILNDHNNLMKDRPKLSPDKLFVKACNSKIIPVILSRFSIILAMLPFVLLFSGDSFWYSLAKTIIGGMLASMILLAVFFPVFLKTTFKTK